MDTGPPGSWDSASVVPGSILRTPDGGYRMWYAGSDGGTWRIGVADSPDGLAWSRVAMVLEPDLPGRWDDTNVYDPTVLFDGAMYYLWYTGEDGTSTWFVGQLGGESIPTGRIGFATSADGLSWVRQGPVVLGTDQDHARAPSAVFGSPRFWLWSGGESILASDNAAPAAAGSSEDGLDFLTIDGLPMNHNSGYWNPAPDFAASGSPAAFRLNADGWGFAFGGHCATYSVGCVPVWRLGAVALYGGTPCGGGCFEIFQGPILDVGPPGAWDDAGVNEPALLPDADTWRLWYGGFDGTTWRIGLANGSCP